MPIYIVENGYGYDDQIVDGQINDDYRIDYMRKHLEQMKIAVSEGVDCRGYLSWGPIDILSSRAQMKKRYGFVYVNRDNDDLKDMKRIKKKSFEWYKKVIASNGERFIKRRYKKMKVTMKDIAKKLNISINAVSIALNEKPGVSDAMRLEILKTADEMGYINEKHHYLSVFSKTNICILMQSYYANTGHFYSIVLRSIVEQARNKGYSSILNYFEDDDFEFPDCILERKVAGILVVGKISDTNLNKLKKTGICVVLVDFTSLGDTCDCCFNSQQTRWLFNNKSCVR